MAKKIAAGALFLLVTITSIFAIAIAKKKHTTARKINVHWDKEFDYTEWVDKNGQTFVNDTLVFKYRNDHGNNYTVYSMKDWLSYFDCDFSLAELIADETAGAGDGFRFVLAGNGNWLYRFACINHCETGRQGMKLIVNPIPHQ